MITEKTLNNIEKVITGTPDEQKNGLEAAKQDWPSILAEIARLQTVEVDSQKRIAGLIKQLEEKEMPVT